MIVDVNYPPPPHLPAYQIICPLGHISDDHSAAEQFAGWRQQNKERIRMAQCLKEIAKNKSENLSDLSSNIVQFFL